MALLFIDGFDAYGTDGVQIAAAMQSALYEFTEAVFASSDTRTGYGFSCHLRQDFPGQGQGQLNLATTLVSEFIIGFSAKVEGNGFFPLVEFYRDDLLGHVAPQCYLAVNGVAGLSLVNGTGALIGASSPNVFFPDSHQYLEIKIVFGGSGSVEVRVDGATVISVPLGSTIGGGQPGFANVIQWNAGGATDYLIDDLYVCDGTGASFNDFLGDCAVHTVFPIADAGPNTMTQFGGGAGHYTDVGEVTPDDDATYLFSNTSGQQEMFSIGALPIDIIDVLAVAVCARAKKSAAGTANYQLVANSGGVETDGPVLPTNVGYITRNMIMTTAPGGGGWTKTAAQALLIGAKIP